uniref:Midkine n=1 Tax=Pavo cristatus TaxID=9049 RepID=A0A8C9L188_PAVCR
MQPRGLLLLLALLLLAATAEAAKAKKADCKYKFESWGGCSAQTGVKTRSGILKKALYNAQCEEVVYVSKPCAAKMKAKAK